MAHFAVKVRKGSRFKLFIIFVNFVIFVNFFFLMNNIFDIIVKRGARNFPRFKFIIQNFFFLLLHTFNILLKFLFSNAHFDFLFFNFLLFRFKIHRHSCHQWLIPYNSLQNSPLQRLINIRFWILWKFLKNTPQNFILTKLKLPST